MILFRKAEALVEYLAAKRGQGLKSGFVPTMGALHEGHLSLLRQASADNDLSVCSIFVNPTQFNDPADFAKYPITTAADIGLLLDTGCDVLFLPSVDEMYPAGTGTAEHYDLGYLETILEGAFRPGHFQGVCRVIERFLELVRPDRFYLGQKDYQQCLVVKRLIGLMGEEYQPELIISPTLREPDGLAMSSRNVRLSAADREKAPLIHALLSEIALRIRPGNIELLKDAATVTLEASDFRPDYVEIADARDLQSVSDWDGRQPLVALVAAFLGYVRLIDNLLLNPPATSE